MRKQLKAPFDNYSIDEYGNIFNKNNYQMSVQTDKDGYYRIILNVKDQDIINRPIHRMVAEYFLNNFDDNLHVDHIDMNKLNNHYLNLRMATKSQNMCNTKKSIANTSGFKGVYLDKRNNKWNVSCQKNGKHHYLGQYENKLDAAHAYMEGAKKLHGEFARWTPIPETDDDFFNLSTSIPLPDSPKPKLKIKFI